MSRRDIEYDSIRDDKHDQPPTVDQILVDQGRAEGNEKGRTVSVLASAQADDDLNNDPSDPQKKKRYYSWWNVTKDCLLLAMIISGFAVGVMCGQRKKEEMRGATTSISKGVAQPATFPQASPTDAPFASPIDAPIDCSLPLSCLGCLQQGCYYGNGGGMGACFSCKHQMKQCNGDTGFCNIFPDNNNGRLQCISYIQEKCPGDR